MDEQTVTVREWTDVVRRARLGRTVKAVALTMATYADYTDGRRVHPGIARVCIDAELSYEIVYKAIATLRALGLLERVSYGSRRGGHADQYRLFLAEDVLDRVDVLMPAMVTKLAEELAEANSGRGRPGKPKKAMPLTPTGADEPDLPMPATGADDVLHGTASGADKVVADSSAPDGVPPEIPSAPDGVLYLPLMPSGTTNQLPTHISATNQTTADLDTAVTVVGADARDDSKIEVLPVRCPHKIRAQRRPDGSSSCALCRVGSKLAAEGSPLTTPTGTFRIIQRGATA